MTLEQRRRQAEERLRAASETFTGARAVAPADPDAAYIAKAALAEARLARMELQRIDEERKRDEIERRARRKRSDDARRE
jgi:hypothetical protein